MRLFDIFKSKDLLTTKIETIKVDVVKIISIILNGEISVFYYGAYEIDPRHLVFWICVRTDEEKKNLQDNNELNSKLRHILIKNEYPKEAIDYVYIGFESQETVDRESDGNWWQHWK